MFIPANRPAMGYVPRLDNSTLRVLAGPSFWFEDTFDVPTQLERAGRAGTKAPRYPKREDGDYVASHGLPVPERWVHQAEALASGAEYVCRSEHWAELLRAAGLFRSIPIRAATLADAFKRVGPVDISDATLLQKQGQGTNLSKVVHAAVRGELSDAEFAIKVHLLKERVITRYAHAIGVEPHGFLREVRFSYWRLLGGMNRWMVADSAIAGRYHLVTRLEDERLSSYALIEDGRIQKRVPNVDDALIGDPKRLIAFYETVRALPRFQNMPSPLIEMQTFEDKEWFLQIHPTQAFSPPDAAEPSFDTSGYTGASWVRGKTPPEGMWVHAGVTYPEEWRPVSEDAGFDGEVDPIAGLVASRLRKVQLIGAKHGCDHKLFAATLGHNSPAQMLQPGLTMMINTDALCDGNWGTQHYKPATRYFNATGMVARVWLHVWSNGRRGLAKLVGPGS